MICSNAHLKVTFFVLVFLIPNILYAQNCDFNFTPVENTGVNMIILIHDNALNTDLLNVGDSLGAFTNINNEMVCLGSIVWDGEHQSLVVWGDDLFTPQQDGMLSNQEITLFAKSSSIIYEVMYQPVLE